MENQRTISYQQASDELRVYLIRLYTKKTFPRMGKIFADQLFTTGTEAGGFLSVLADLDEIHVKRDTAQSALISLKRADYILKTMKEAGYYSAADVEELLIFFNKIIPAVKGLLVEVYDKIDRTNARMLEKAATFKEEKKEEEKREERLAEKVKDEGETSADVDPDGFYSEV